MTLLRAEWTKFWSVPAWPIGTGVAALMLVLFAVLAGLSGGHPDGAARPIPIGPGGEPVTDSYYFVHRPLTGDGGVTVPITSLSTTVAWAKAGLLITAGTDPGASYAAVMVTGGHGVRMQDDYLHDRAGRPGDTPRWLRLTRTGDTVTGAESTDGEHWQAIGTVRLPALTGTVQVGLFVASPPEVQGNGTAPATATAKFGAPDLVGSWPPAEWRGEQIGAGTATFGGNPLHPSSGFAPSGSGFAVTGVGDIAPATRLDLPTDGVIGELLMGTFAALIAVIVVATMYITSEYRHGLIQTTLAASPRRGQVLAAKAVVLGGVTFLTSLAAAVVAVPLGEHLAHAHGVYLFPVTGLTRLRVEVGTAALLAVAAVLALAAGTVLRRSAPTVTSAVAAIVLPYLLVLTPFMPGPAARWLTLVTPTAALAVQQTLTPYPQVATVYIPANGYYPLPPWGGFAVLCGYAAVVLGLATFSLRQRDT